MTGRSALHGLPVGRLPVARCRRPFLPGHAHTRQLCAIQDAIHSAWRRLRADKLEAGYAAAVADNPHYPYESAEEAAVLRARCRARQQRGTLT